MRISRQFPPADALSCHKQRLYRLPVGACWHVAASAGFAAKTWSRELRSCWPVSRRCAWFVDIALTSVVILAAFTAAPAAPAHAHGITRAGLALERGAGHLTLPAASCPVGVPVQTITGGNPLPSIYGAQEGLLTLPKGCDPSGSVQTKPLVHLIFWGPSWQTDTTGIVAAELALFRELPGSGYQAILGQYGVSTPSLAGVVFDSRMPPTHRSLWLPDLAREAARVRSLHHWADGPSAQWIILPQLGTDMSSFSNECGEHDEVYSGSRTYYVALIPPFQDPRYGYDCIYDYSDGQQRTPDLVAATTGITSHEYAETATDPAATGWTTRHDNAEVADLCAWYSGIPAGMTVNVSYLWSNAQGGCVI